MKNKKRTLVIFLFILAILIGIGLFIFLSDENRLTSAENRWLNENASNVQNVHIINNVDMFGNAGVGIYYDFLNDFTSTYDITFNPITINSSEEEENLSFLVGNSLPSNAFSFYEDHYVLISKNSENLMSFQNITGKKIGILNTNSEYIQNHLATLKDNTFTVYNSKESLVEALDTNAVNYILVPRIENISTVLEKKYWIVYHFSDLKRYFYVADESNSTLYQIFIKFFAKWQEELETNLYEQERTIFAEKLQISASLLDELQNTPITYGYQNYMPYEIHGDNQYGGIVAEYLKTFASFIDADIDYKKYSNERRFIKDINDSKITLYTNFYNYGVTGTDISLNLPITFSIYAHKENDIVIESLATLKNYPIYVEEDSYLQTRLSVLDGCTLKTFDLKDIKDVLKDEENIILLDKRVGDELLKDTLKDYSSRFTYDLNISYSLKSIGNDTLNTLLTRYINYLDNKTLINKGLYQSEILEKRGTFIGSLARYALYTIIIIVVILLMIYRSSKKVRLQKKIKKEDKLKYMDQLTSLKNRNYLHENMATWNKNTIYPQSVIIIDLKRVQEINDTLGYEEGDRQIKAAANILIKTQLDNSDIIRTNGNEFMIYLIGYNQKQVTSYMNKLMKNFKTLPFNYGVAISYSMIESDLKSIEDAINECVDEIKKQKKDEEK